MSRHSAMILRVSLVALSATLGADRGFAQDPQPLPVSKGVYRLPYADGTTVRFSNNHLNHPTTRNRTDMTGQPGDGPFTVVTAAAGWIRWIEESNGTFCPNACGNSNNCDGVGGTSTDDNDTAQSLACDGYSGPAAFCCERDYEANGGDCPGSGTCLNGANNFVWMEHPNGEWTKYTHMRTGSVGLAGAGRVENEFVPAGTPIGIEGDIGFASGPHVHFEVAVPYYVELPPPNDMDVDPDSPPATRDDWFTGSGFLVNDIVEDDVIFEDPDGDGVNNPDDDVNRQNRIPIFCQVGFAVAGEQNTAGPCDDQCQNGSLVLSGTINPADAPFYEQVSGDMGNANNAFIIKTNAGASIRAGGTIYLSPGFHAELDSFFAASIGTCDSPGGTGD